MNHIKNFFDLYDAQHWRNKDNIGKEFISFEGIKQLNKKTKIPKREMRRIFNRPMTLYFILASEHEEFQIYIDLAKKYNMLNKIRINYSELQKFRQLCSCSGCFPPAIKIAIKNNLINGLNLSTFRKTWRDGEYTLHQSYN